MVSLFSARLMLLFLCCLLAYTAHAQAVRSFSHTIAVDGKNFTVHGLVVDLRDPSVSLKVGLANGHVGQTESLSGIAKRYGAVAAINGSFFEAYTNDTIKNPDMSLISDGHFIFRSDLGALLGFEKDNTPHIGVVNVSLRGTLRQNRRVQSWYAYYINRLPSSAQCITLFTRTWGAQVEPMGGSCVVVEHETVTNITCDTVTIPADGYVIHFRGEVSMRLCFQLGQHVTLTPRINAIEQDNAPWERVQEAVGAGPMVLVHGNPVSDSIREGFADPKILERAGTRSAAGFTANKKLYLITVSSAHVSELGAILKALGCDEGMNLDGGASSGLWFRGKYLTSPGRAISNALLVITGK